MAKTKDKKKGTDKNKPAKTLKEKKQDKKDKKKGACLLYTSPSPRD